MIKTQRWSTIWDDEGRVAYVGATWDDVGEQEDGSLLYPEATMIATEVIFQNMHDVWRTANIGGRLEQIPPGTPATTKRLPKPEQIRVDSISYSYGAAATSPSHTVDMPDGSLSGLLLPLPSRIVHACDAWHTMSSDRPYREALSADEAVEEIGRNAGRQFDPRVVPALAGVLSDRNLLSGEEAQRLNGEEGHNTRRKVLSVSYVRTGRLRTLHIRNSPCIGLGAR
jgi:hypothetical protein